MTENTCTKCGLTKPIAEFYKHPLMPSGYLNQCKDCKKAQSRKWQIENAEHRKVYFTKWLSENRQHVNSEARRRYKENPSSRNASYKKFYARVKLAVYEAYGGQCYCCGEYDMRFLTLDHVNNDGAEDRKKGVKGTRLWDWAVRNNFPATLQLSCWNCNCAKFHNDGICPHKTPLAALEAA